MKLVEFFGQCLSPVLCKGIAFQSLGKWPCLRDCSNILPRIIKQYSLVLFRNLELILPTAAEEKRISSVFQLFFNTNIINYDRIPSNKKNIKHWGTVNSIIRKYLNKHVV